VLEERGDRDREGRLRATSCWQVHHSRGGVHEPRRTLLRMLHGRHRSAGFQVLRTKTMPGANSRRRSRAHRTLPQSPQDVSGSQLHLHGRFVKTLILPYTEIYNLLLSSPDVTLHNCGFVKFDTLINFKNYERI